jgi:hypothetical protein
VKELKGLKVEGVERVVLWAGDLAWLTLSEILFFQKIGFLHRSTHPTFNPFNLFFKVLAG